MTFLGVDNQSVELKISNYQYPQINTTGDYDANWLLIYLNIKSKLGHWQTIDASLLTWDVEKIIKWFTDLANNKNNIDKSLEFIEPNLSFQLIKNEDGIKRIRLRFELESRPKSAKDDIDYYVECIMPPNELRQAANDLSVQLSKFPKR